MRELFLFGGGWSRFEQLSEAFVRAAGGPSARIGLLFSDPAHIPAYFDRYAGVWSKFGADVTPIAPEPSGRVSRETLRLLRECTAFFMGGGETRRYHEVYVKSRVRSAIESLYRDGRPYGGLSAGAMAAAGTCLVWGDSVVIGSESVFVGGSESGCDAPVTLDQGFDFLSNAVVEAHFTSRSGFPRLALALELTGERLGIGIDDDVCVQITDERWMRVYGRGRCYVLEWDKKGAFFRVRAFDPSDGPADLQRIN